MKELQQEVTKLRRHWYSRIGRYEREVNNIYSQAMDTWKQNPPSEDLCVPMHYIVYGLYKIFQLYYLFLSLLCSAVTCFIEWKWS